MESKRGGERRREGREVENRDRGWKEGEIEGGMERRRGKS